MALFQLKFRPIPAEVAAKPEPMLAVFRLDPGGVFLVRLVLVSVKAALRPPLGFFFRSEAEAERRQKNRAASPPISPGVTHLEII